MAYRTTGQVNFDGKLYAPEKSISFKDGQEDIRDALIEAGVVVEVKSSKKAVDEGTDDLADKTADTAKKTTAATQ